MEKDLVTGEILESGTECYFIDGEGYTVEKENVYKYLQEKHFMSREEVESEWYSDENEEGIICFTTVE